jgi:hypothetical protein
MRVVTGVDIHKRMFVRRVYSEVQASEPTVTVFLPGTLCVFLTVGGAVESCVCGGVGASVGRRKRDDGLAVTRELQPRSATRATKSSQRHRAWIVQG